MKTPRLPQAGDYTKTISDRFNATWRRDDLFNYTGSYEDFREGSDRYYAQLAVDYHGSAVRDNCIAQLIAIGEILDKADNYCPE